MKKLLLLICTVFLSITVSIAQNTKTFVCSYHGTPKYSKEDICSALGFTSNREAEDIVDNILNQVGLKRNFIVMECPDTDNCFAVTLPSDIGLIRYIIYDNQFLKSLEGASSESWASKSILAHEIAHHLNGHTLDGLGGRPSKELEADEFSGFVMAKLGATLEQAQLAIIKVASDYATATHPAKSSRLNAIKKGWRTGSSNSINRNNNISNNSVNRNKGVSGHKLRFDHTFSNRNLKSEPNALSDIIYNLKDNSNCIFLNHSKGSYVKVDCDGIIGYSNEMYFTNIPENLNKTTETFQRSANLNNSSIDFDGDGVPDVKDKCRTTAGSPSNNGCPVIKAEDIRILNLDVQNIRFDIERATLRSESYGILDQVVDFLIRYPDYNVTFRGYADDSYDSELNQILSENRARTCNNYVISKGITSRRISIQGYGATTTTSGENSTNRLVEIDFFLR